MKKIVFTAAIFLGIAFTASAQEKSDAKIVTKTEKARLVNENEEKLKVKAKQGIPAEKIKTSKDQQAPTPVNGVVSVLPEGQIKDEAKSEKRTTTVKKITRVKKKTSVKKNK